MSLSAIDSRGKTLTLPAPPVRIVSLVPSCTETLFALGLDDRIAGVTRYCERPPDKVAAKPKLGGTKNPAIEAILALEPDLVIVNEEENRREHADALARRAPVFTTFARTVEDVIREVRALGALAGTPERAEEVAREIERALAEVRAEARGAPPLRVAELIWRKPYFTVNGDTYMSDLVSACGGVNVFAAKERRYPEVTLEEIAAASPDAVLFPDEPYPFKERHLAGFRALDVPAARAGRLLLADGQMLCWHGVRTAQGLRYLRSLLRGA